MLIGDKACPEKKPNQQTLGHFCSFLCRPQSAADDDTSSELQRLAAMDAPLQRRGGFRRWVSPLPCCYPSIPWGLSDHGVLSVPRGLSSKTSGKRCQCCPSSTFSPEEAPVSRLGVAVQVSLQTCLWQCWEERCFPAEGYR